MFLQSRIVLIYFLRLKFAIFFHLMWCLSTIAKNSISNSNWNYARSEKSNKISKSKSWVWENKNDLTIQEENWKSLDMLLRSININSI
jgi:hypothetical protein